MEPNTLFVKMIFDRWNALLKNCDAILDALTDEQLLSEIAPGRNRGIYLLGHLIAIHDDMLSLLDLGDRQQPALFETFVKSPDKSVEAIPPASELRSLWKNQLQTLTPKLESFSAEEWFEKHNAISAEDFVKEPYRNKLNVLITRTTHLAYHVGQLKLLN